MRDSRSSFQAQARGGAGDKHLAIGRVISGVSSLGREPQHCRSKGEKISKPVSSYRQHRQIPFQVIPHQAPLVSL